jgi:hypothetical protein
MVSIILIPRKRVKAKMEILAMTFQPGQSGNPAGRAVGSRNKKTLAAEAALFDHAKELVEDLVRRAKNGEPAAMRLVMERVLPAGRGRPLPIELPSIRSTEDALAAADVIMDALKEGAVSAREAVDLLRVVEGLTRLTAVIPFIQKVARREVAKAAQTLGLEHFLAGPPAANNYARRVREMNGREGTPADNEDLPDRHPDECRSTQDPLYRCGDEDFAAAPAAPEDLPDASALADRLQIVADSDDGARRAEVG